MSSSETHWRYPGWRVVIIAAAAMVGTLPGRTVGLGLITEPLIADLDITRVQYANLTLWSTIVGALFSPICGRCIDRWGTRISLAAVLILLAGTTVGMSWYVSASSLLLFLVLSRGFGQSALSTAAVTAVGKWFRSGLGVALGAFSAMVAVGFAAAIPITGGMITAENWRACWQNVGIAVGVLAPLALVLIPVSGQLEEPQPQQDDQQSVAFLPAIGSWLFWVFTISVALYYLVMSGMTLFGESLLQQRGFDRSAFIMAMMTMMAAGLAGNFVVGGLASKVSTTRMLAASLFLLAVVLLGLTRPLSVATLMVLFAVYGFCGGAFSVLFFVGYGRAYGPKHLGKIQGVAQAIGVVASALGPKLFAETFALTGAYDPALSWLGLAAVGFGFVAWLTPMRTNIAAEK